MEWHKTTLSFQTHQKGLYEFTGEINHQISEWGIQEGMAYLFIQHTSASMVINESYDPTARQDLNSFLEKIAPEGQSWHLHTLEGRDDSPSHIRTMLTHSSLTIPVDEGRLSLGTWQGIYLAEHRQHGHRRHVLLRVLQVK